MKIFLSWQGQKSRAVAESLNERLGMLFNDDDVETWISTHDIGSGERWQSQLSEQLQTCDFGLLFVTQENIDEPWLIYEAGALSKCIDSARVIPYLIDLDVSCLEKSPLSIFQARKADCSGTKQLLNDIRAYVGNKKLTSKSFESRFEGFWDKFSIDLNSICEDFGVLKNLINSKKKLDSGFKKYLENHDNKTSFYLNRLVENVILRATEILIDSESKRRILLPSSLYSSELLGLLQVEYKPPVKAVAIIDKEETFWNKKMGFDILNETPDESIRIFSFSKPDHLQSYMPVISKHSNKYDVYVTTHSKLSQIYNHEPYDFSIIGDINNSILAYYDDNYMALENKIIFENDDEKISRHHDLFMQIKELSIQFDDSLPDNEYKYFVNQVFTPFNKILNASTARAEMSLYIPIHDYDKHEIKHAYYKEMMHEMIKICNSFNKKDKITALEMGAGSGIFTRKLLGNCNIDMTAIEIDWPLYHLLLNNIKRCEVFVETEPDEKIQIGVSDEQARNVANLMNVFKSEQLNAKIRCFNADCRSYDPSGTFDFIFSSFSDHHIKPQDKGLYFSNMRKNLNPGGIVIVGDEFLPPHNERDPKEREFALQKYHQHIIDQTILEHGEVEASGLVVLEKNALASGIKGLGDFKLSCETYEKHVNEAGFKVIACERIGPDDTISSDVGGVYVWVFTVDD